MLITQSYLTLLRPQGLQPTRLLCPWNPPGKNTGVNCHSLLQGIFLTQGQKPGFPHCRQTLYSLSHQGSPAFTLIKLGLRSNYREGTQPHPLAENWIKDLLSMAPPIRARPRFPQGRAESLQSCLYPMDLQPTRLLCPQDSPGKNTGVVCHSLLQGIFPTQRQNSSVFSFLLWQASSLPLAPPGKPLTSPSYQEASTSLIHQRADRIKNHNHRK